MNRFTLQDGGFELEMFNGGRGDASPAIGLVASSTAPLTESHSLLEKWVAASPGQLLMVLVSSVCVYAAILIYTRIAGLRSFSKMSAADFAMTIATGSLFGATISSPTPTLLMGSFAILCIFAAQWGVAILRTRSDLVSRAVDNQPLLIMAGSEILHDNLRRANMTEDDLFGKLREANAMNFEQIKAVVFETTGDVSVIHSANDLQLDPQIFSNVVDCQRLRAREQGGQIRAQPEN